MTTALWTKKEWTFTKTLQRANLNLNQNRDLKKKRKKVCLKKGNKFAI